MREAIVLAGGRGTRLQEVLGELPKPLAPVAGRPFLHWLLDWLERIGVDRVLLSVGYRREAIVRAVGTAHGQVRVEYVVEEEPLGTGGAIALALRRCRTERVLCLNGDTYFDVDIARMTAETEGADLAVALRQVADVGRFGAVECLRGRIVGFFEKGGRGPGLINGGMYLMSRARVLEAVPAGPFSFETDFMARRFRQMDFRGFVGAGYFIDIGVPSSLEAAQRELPLLPSAVLGVGPGKKD